MREQCGAGRLDRAVGQLSGPAGPSDGNLAELLATARALKDVFADAHRRGRGAARDDAPASLREENLALTRELSERARLLASHRQRLDRWRAECAEVSSAASEGAGLEPQPDMGHPPSAAG